jgi:hypothetical protein
MLKEGDHFVTQFGDGLLEVEIKAGETAITAQQRAI